MGKGMLDHLNGLLTRALSRSLTTWAL
jgi:hypothetical protein